MKKLLLIFCTIVFSLSYSQKKESQRFSTNKRLLNKMLKKNGNVFELIAPGGNVSYIWTYSSNMITIYSLIQGKKKSLNSYPLNDSNLEWLIQKDFKQYRLPDCQVVDGRLLIINIINKEESNKLIEKEYSIDIECLKETEFNSIFYKKLSNDMKTYKIG
ncbi:hypothetical protein [Chryseobacterium oryctis]|uniref:Uncharacterized protein n=1 Tax=Chryseobacterium oryctis TaxID=2952618 RepID=A0ABT3HL01_9FLAO|nr:hypothetical protein [Chryseobacterium oryctis]MCW3160452.1 hypothetical protein [Chryseobacterium oryctis]